MASKYPCTKSWAVGTGQLWNFLYNEKAIYSKFYLVNLTEGGLIAWPRNKLIL